MRRQPERKPKPRPAQARDANRKPRPRRLLEIEVLESRLPVSEQIGTALGVSALSYVGGLAARFAAASATEQTQPVKVVTAEAPRSAGLMETMNAVRKASESKPSATAASEVRLIPVQPAQTKGMRTSPVGMDELGTSLMDDLTKDFFDLLGSATAGRRGRINPPDTGSGSRIADPLLGQSAAGGAGGTMHTPSSLADTPANTIQGGMAAGTVPATSAAPALAAFQGLPALPYSTGGNGERSPADQNGQGNGDKDKKPKDTFDVLDANYGIVVTPGVPDRQLVSPFPK